MQKKQQSFPLTRKRIDSLKKTAVNRAGYLLPKNLRTKIGLEKIAELEKKCESYKSKVKGIADERLRHDLRQFVTFLSHQIGFLEHEYNNQNPKTVFKKITAIDFMIKIQEELLLRSKPNTQFLPQPVSFQQIVDSMRNASEFYSAKPLIKTFFASNKSLTNSGKKLFVDTVGLIRVMQNLFGNSYSATKLDGKIWLKVELEKGKLKFAFTDNGKGMTAEQIKKFMDGERFSRKGEFGGQGLETVREIVKAHGGKVSIQSVLGKGTTFNIEIPVKYN